MVTEEERESGGQLASTTLDGQCFIFNETPKGKRDTTWTVIFGNPVCYTIRRVVVAIDASAQKFLSCSNSGET